MLKRCVGEYCCDRSWYQWTVFGHQLAQMMQAIGPDRQVFWINVRVPTRAWQNDVNSKLDAAQKQYKNLTVIDWFINPMVILTGSTMIWCI